MYAYISMFFAPVHVSSHVNQKRRQNSRRKLTEGRTAETVTVNMKLRISITDRVGSSC